MFGELGQKPAINTPKPIILHTKCQISVLNYAGINPKSGFAEARNHGCK